MVTRTRILAALLGLAAAVGAHWLPAAPSGGDGARRERLTTHGNRAVGALAVDHYGAALHAVATGLGIVEAPATTRLRLCSVAQCVETGGLGRRFIVAWSPQQGNNLGVGPLFCDPRPCDAYLDRLYPNRNLE
ncbi:MAG: hypothetical protein Q8S73_03570 [Deltaproteobacteria bacterium]|nr:hypothetical protein [Myxococcales bacterium]MDP3213158.1 hypothetical protein [Deltaproteobacteria bacterium]